MLPITLALITLAITWVVIMPVRFRIMNGGDDTPLTFTLKGIPTACAAAVAIYAALCVNPAPYARWMALGLVVCLAADIVLGIRFVVGGFLFLCGHICYIIALMGQQSLSHWNAIIFVVAMIALQIFLFTFRKHINSKLLYAGVCLYATALSALLAAALPLPITGIGARPLLAAAGALLFVVSDATLCDNMLNKRPVINQYISLGIYYTAQFLLGLSTLPVV